MSGSGGFYKYRCKYFYSHNCTNWVWVKNAPCATCLAEGRESDPSPSLSHLNSSEIISPDISGGILQESLLGFEKPDALDDERLLSVLNVSLNPMLPEIMKTRRPSTASYEVW